MAVASSRSAVFVDLDRTLLRCASGPVLHAAMVEGGVLDAGAHLPGDRHLYRFYDRFGETVPSIGLARLAVLAMRGRAAEATLAAGERAVPALMALVAPYARRALAEHRAAGRQLVLATTSPAELVTPFASAFGIDDVIATRYQVSGGRFTGRLEGRFVWGAGKWWAVRQWCREAGVDAAASHAYSDSVFDVPLLDSIGHPHALNPDPRLAVVAAIRRWPIESWERPPGVPSLLGCEPYHALRHLFRPVTFPGVRFDIEGLGHIPGSGPVLLAANHRSYFDVAPLGIVAARMGRPVRFLAKREIFEAPVVGPLARALGGIPVDRTGGTTSPMADASAALEAGDAVLVLPQGTIPRGEAFFDPVLVGKTGTVRLAMAIGAPVVPIGLWGTEAVWPRSAKVPQLGSPLRPLPVRVRIGPPIRFDRDDPTEATERLMAIITSLLPPQARVRYRPSADEIARAMPSG